MENVDLHSPVMIQTVQFYLACAHRIFATSDLDFVNLLDMSAQSGLDEKGFSSSMRQEQEVESIHRQIQFPDVKVSFFTLFQYATPGDLFVVAISTVCALAAGALVPLPLVQQQNISP